MSTDAVLVLVCQRETGTYCRHIVGNPNQVSHMHGSHYMEVMSEGVKGYQPGKCSWAFGNVNGSTWECPQT